MMSGCFNEHLLFSLREVQVGRDELSSNLSLTLPEKGVVHIPACCQ